MVSLECVLLVLASLSSLELWLEEADDDSGAWLQYSMGEVPGISAWMCAVALVVDRSATGDEISCRNTGFPPRWVAALPKRIGLLICGSVCFFARVLKARANDMSLYRLEVRRDVGPSLLFGMVCARLLSLKVG